MMSTFFIEGVSTRMPFETRMTEFSSRVTEMWDRNFTAFDRDRFETQFPVDPSPSFWFPVLSGVSAYQPIFSDLEMDRKRDIGLFGFYSNEFMACFGEEASDLISGTAREDFPEERVSLLCRQFAELIVAAVESALRIVTDTSKSTIFQPFLKMGGLSNEIQLKAFGLSLTKAMVSYSQNVLDDFLAIKFLRNTRAHGVWKQHQKVWVKDRGFPTDLRRFDPSHWVRMRVTYRAMMDYILEATLAPLWKMSSRVDEASILQQISRLNPHLKVEPP